MKGSNIDRTRRKAYSIGGAEFNLGFASIDYESASLFARNSKRNSERETIAREKKERQSKAKKELERARKWAERAERRERARRAKEDRARAEYTLQRAGLTSFAR